MVDGIFKNGLVSHPVYSTNKPGRRLGIGYESTRRKVGLGKITPYSFSMLGLV